MRFPCLCGQLLSNAGSPNGVEHLLIDAYGIEQLQQLVHTQVEAQGTRIDWPDNWEESGAIEVWKCRECNRLYVFPRGSRDFDKVVVYRVEQVGV